jgi:group I intron endonuclease
MNKICGIYKITSPSGKIYIGQSTNIIKRKYHYRTKLGIGQPKIYNSIVKYGWNNHKFEIICKCDENELNDLEKYYIKLFNSFNGNLGLNLTDGGDSIKLSNETKQKISNSLRGIKRSEATKKKISKSKKGFKQYTQTKLINKKISNSLRGIKRSEVTKKKMSESKTGLVHTSKTKNKISNTKSSTYTIYNNNNIIFYKFHGNIKKELKKYNLPENSFCNSYRNNTKIKKGKYKNWYVIKED